MLLNVTKSLWYHQSVLMMGRCLEHSRVLKIFPRNQTTFMMSKLPDDYEDYPDLSILSDDESITMDNEKVVEEADVVMDKNVGYFLLPTRLYKLGATARITFTKLFLSPPPIAWTLFF
jgi:hypothetical protein